MHIDLNLNAFDFYLIILYQYSTLNLITKFHFFILLKARSPFVSLMMFHSEFFVTILLCIMPGKLTFELVCFLISDQPYTSHL